MMRNLSLSKNTFISMSAYAQCEDAALLRKGSLLLSVFMVIILVQVCTAQNTPSSLNLTPVEAHHVAELNSNQPYVAGYAAISPDLSRLKAISAATINVSFMDTDPDYFPSDAWLGAGLFLQGQDNHYVFVDYGFYIMLVLDASGRLFLDVGFHQTRESSAPIQMPTSDLLYSYAWQVTGISTSSTVTLGAQWDLEGFVHYWVFAEEFNVTLPPINVAGLPNCETMQRQFWSGNMRAGGFPFGHYVYYFQFGVISPMLISDNHWSVRLSNPQMMKKPEGKWIPVDLAVTTQGDICYLDWDWMWGGAPYHGVSAKYHKNPFENPYEVEFFYKGETLAPGTVLWHYIISESETSATIASAHTTDISQAERLRIFSIGMAIIIGLIAANFVLRRFGRKLIKFQRVQAFRE
jgi:hypothetical protein